jgi:hypothetical protein
MGGGGRVVRRAVAASRLPPPALIAIFQFLSLRDLAACMRVCRHWATVLEYEVSRLN